MGKDELLTVPEVAAHFKVTPEAVRRWLRQGRIKGIRLGGDKTGWRIRESEVERFLAEREGAVI